MNRIVILDKNTRFKFWAIIRSLKVKFSEADPKELINHIKDQYGIEIQLLNGYYQADTYIVVDESKYLLFLLKYE